MSVPFTPGVEQGTSLEGNIELDESDIVDYEFTENQLSRQQEMHKDGILDFGDQAFLLRHVFTPDECQDFVRRGEDIGFEQIRGVRDDYRSCKR